MKSSEIDEEPLLPHVDVECAQCSLYSTQCVHVAHTRHMHARQPAVLCMRGCALRIYIYSYFVAIFGVRANVRE